MYANSALGKQCPLKSMGIIVCELIFNVWKVNNLQHIKQTKNKRFLIENLFCCRLWKCPWTLKIEISNFWFLLQSWSGVLAVLGSSVKDHVFITWGRSCSGYPVFKATSVTVFQRVSTTWQFKQRKQDVLSIDQRRSLVFQCFMCDRVQFNCTQYNFWLPLVRSAIERRF